MQSALCFFARVFNHAVQSLLGKSFNVFLVVAMATEAMAQPPVSPGTTVLSQGQCEEEAEGQRGRQCGLRVKLNDILRKQWKFQK